MPVTLWPYQVDPVQQIRAHLADGKRRILFWMPTGAGKGTVATYIIENALQKGRRILFLVNRQLLCEDMSWRLDRLGIDHGVIMSNHPRRKPWLSVFVASVDTLHRRPILPPADLIFIDEAHHAASPIWGKVLDRYPSAAVIGMSATPCRLDAKPLDMFQVMVYGPTVAELIEINANNRSQGVVPLRTFAPSRPDLTGVHTSHGDYNQKELAAACNKRQLVGDIVQHWLKLGRGRPTIGWACDIPHSKHCMEQFRAAGIRAEHMDNTMPLADRRRMLDRLCKYEIEVVWSIGVLGYGVDAPAVSCGISARPTQSLALWLQQIGRLARAYPGKEYSILLDHASNTTEHGFFEDDRVWTLEGDNQGRRKNQPEEDDGPGVRTCKACWCCFPASQDKCPECGTPYVGKGRKIDHVDGELKELAPVRRYKCDGCGHAGRLPDGATFTTHACDRCQAGPLYPLGGKPQTFLTKDDLNKRKQLWFELFEEGRSKGYKPGWAKMQFNQRSRGGGPPHWPPKKWVEEAESRAAVTDFAAEPAFAEEAVS